MNIDTLVNCGLTVMKSIVRCAKRSGIDKTTLRMLLYSINNVIDDSYNNDKLTDKIPDPGSNDELIGTLLIEFTCNDVPAQYTIYAYMPESENDKPYVHLFSDDAYRAFTDHPHAYFGLSVNWNMLLNNKTFEISLAAKSKFGKKHIRDNFGPNQMFSFIKIVKFACEYLSTLLAQHDSLMSDDDNDNTLAYAHDIDTIKDIILAREVWMGENMIKADDKIDPIEDDREKESAISPEQHISLLSPPSLESDKDDEDDKKEEPTFWFGKPKPKDDSGKSKVVVINDNDPGGQIGDFISRILGIGGLYNNASDNNKIDFGGRYDGSQSSSLNLIDDLVSSIASVVVNTIKLDWKVYPLVYGAIDKYIKLNEYEEEAETLYGSEFMEVKELICVFAALSDEKDYTVYGIYNIDGGGKYNVKRVSGAIAKNFVERSQRKAYPCLMISDASAGASLSTTPQFIDADRMERDFLHKDFLCLISAVFKKIYRDRAIWLNTAFPNVVIEHEDFGKLLSTLEENNIFNNKQKITETIALMNMITEYITTGNRFISGMEEPIKHLYDTYIETPFGDYFYDCEDLMWKLNATDNTRQKSVFGFQNKFILYHDYFRMDINDVQWANTTLYDDFIKILKYLDATMKEDKKNAKDKNLLDGIRFRN